MADVTVLDHGTIAELHGETDAGLTWLDTHLDVPPGALHVVERRCVPAIVEAIKDAGLTVGPTSG